jgi:hypothetical protein
MHVHPDTDRLPHEPLRVLASTLPFLVRLLARAVGISLVWTFTIGLWPAFLLGSLVWGWPPHQSRPRDFVRYLRWVWTETPPAPGIAPLSRAWLALSVLGNLGRVPLHGLAWYLDELLFGRVLSAAPVRAPVFVLSAARSGSTQISHYLEEDPRLAAPISLQIIAPYLWLWMLVRPTLGRVVPPSVPRSIFDRMITDEFRQRHEGDPLRTDTFEVLFSLGRLNVLAFLLGPRLLRQEFGFSRPETGGGPLWEGDFVDFIDRLARKTVRFAGPGPDGSPRRFFIKGHFQRADDALAQRYPDAHFVTVVRDPIKRLRSQVNHMHGNGADEALGAVPWAWLVASLVDAEESYCEREQEWYSSAEGPARTVVRFRDYVSDLEGTMQRIYGDCFGDTELPPHVPTVHARRERKNYRVDRSLEELGVDMEACSTRLSSYREWCRGEERPAETRPA